MNWAKYWKWCLRHLYFWSQSKNWRNSWLIFKISNTWNATVSIELPHTFRGCLVRKNYAVRELSTHVSQFVLFCLFAKKYPWFRNFIASAVKWFEAQNTRNLPCEMTAATRINLYTRFISCMFLCCEHVLRSSRESSVADLKIF